MNENHLDQCYKELIKKPKMQEVKENKISLHF